MAAGPAAVEIAKTMCLTRAEFESSLGVLLGRSIAPAEQLVRVPLGAGHVDIGFNPQNGVRLGGLLTLPRAVVTIAFDGVPRPARDEFVQRFDAAFQRGGG